MKYIESSALLLLLVAASILTISSNSNYAMADGSLDGKSYAITYKDNGEDKTDEISFEEGGFSSIECDRYGFGASTYETKKRDTSTIFKSTLLSENEGTVKWSGIIDGDHVLGKFVWTKDGQKTKSYRYSGTLIKKDKEI